MSRETLNWLNNNVLVGYGHKAWHFSEDEQGAEANHYDYAIPADDVKRRLFAWDAVQVPVGYDFITNDDAKHVELPKHKAIVRSDSGDFLGIMSDRYTVHQFADSLLGGAEKITGSGLGISSAGLLKGGAVGWVSVSLADTITTPEGIEFLPYLMCYGSHDGSLPTGYKRVVTNVVCDNTMGMALSEKKGGEYRIKHTRNSALRIADAQAALSIVLATGDDYMQQVKELCEVTVTDRQWSEFLNAYVPIEDDAKGRGLTMAESKREKLTELWRNDGMVTAWKNTAYGVVQAVNTYTHHHQTVRGTIRQERNMLGALDGSFEALDKDTLETLNLVLANA